MKPVSMNPVSILAGVLALAAVPALAQAASANPDFTGAWAVSAYTPSLKPVDGKPVPFKPEARAVYAKHLADAAKGDKTYDTTGICLPEGVPRIMLKEPFEILQRGKEIAFVAQNRVPWRVYMNEALPTDPDPLFMGYSVGKWQGGALVVDSSGFRDTTLLDDKGLPHSEALRLTQRLRLGKDGKTMTVSFTIDDPKTYTRPWTARATFVKKPKGFEFPEEVCAEKLESTAPKR
jgi:hypothetical protein